MSEPQPARQRVWALILAGGDGSRLRALTTKPCGTAVPKQFCSLRGGHSLLEDAISRAAGLVAPERLCTIVAQQHRQWWSETRMLQALPAANLIVQPRNRGTAIGILYAVLNILARDPHARIVLLPADHYVREESILAAALSAAVERVERDVRRPVLLGLHPDELDTDLGYIVPGAADPRGGACIERFVEKPDAALAREIIAHGGLWNTFIMVASGQTLVNMFLPRHAAMVMEMQVIVSRAANSGSPAGGWPAIVDMYERLPELDFSRDLLEGHESRLSLIKVPPCGWSDLGTPRRVGETLRRLQITGQAVTAVRTSHINLATQHAHFERMQTEPLATSY